MREVSPRALRICLLLGTLLLGCSLFSVYLQYRTRTLFVEHERALDVARRLSDDQAELAMRVRRASLPGYISQGAAELGLATAKGENTVVLVVDKNKLFESSRPPIEVALPEAVKKAFAQSEKKQEQMPAKERLKEKGSDAVRDKTVPSQGKRVQGV